MGPGFTRGRRDAALVAAPRRWIASRSARFADHHGGERRRSLRWAPAAVLGPHPNHPGARRLLADSLPTLGRAGNDAEWPWPEPRLSYANATVADALLAGGDALGREESVADGLRLLRWLFAVQTVNGHLSPVPGSGWASGETRPGFDQQPIEVSALADAAVRALALTGDPSWVACVDACVAWFAGDNDARVAMYDPVTGGGYDGLEWAGRNANQGAESTLAAMATIQHAWRLGIAKR